MKPGTLLTGGTRDGEGIVYALLVHGRALYVGQTVDPHARYAAHRQRWNPDVEMVVLEGPMPRDELKNAEASWIDRLDVAGTTTVGMVTFEHGWLENNDAWTRKRRADRATSSDPL
jgi:hypothetical protein